MDFIPYNFAAAITKSDTVDIPEGLTEAVYVGGAGTCTVVFQNGGTAALTVAVGDILPLQIKRVNNSGTATLLVALYHR